MTRFRTLGFGLALLASLPLLAAKPQPGEGNPRPEAQRVILRTEHPLLDFEREQLEQMGVRILREIGSRQYIIRAKPESQRQVEQSLFVAGVESFGAERRIQSSARRETARFGSTARLNVLFHEDVSVEEARAVVAKAGGWLASPLDVRFRMPRRLEVFLPDSNLDALAGQDAVLQIHGPERPIKSANASAANISNVTPLYEAPYNLSGAGVVVSVFDFGASAPALADNNHPEFEGRVIKHGTDPIENHPTHVTGTIAAKGINASAKGMAPAVRVENFAAMARSFLDDKNDNFPTLGIRADNNSWGFVSGWNNEGGTWEWYGEPDGAEDLFFGAYGFSTAALDQIVRETDGLIIYASANDNNDLGPTVPPFEHTHVDDTLRYCFTSNGSGTDCPPVCNRCETVRHVRDGPWGTVNLVASGKNTIAVGAISASLGLVSFSSTGPTRDGRIKPELVARGFNMTSTLPNGGYGVLSGTSMAAPVVTGIAALVVEQWKRTFGGANPGAEALRVMLIHGARDLATPPGNPGPDYAYGFGVVDAKSSVDTIIEDGGTGNRIKRGTVTQGATIEYTFTLSTLSSPRFTLGWMDPESLPFPARALINDLDLRVVGPEGTTFLPFVLNPADPAAAATRGVNTRDNIEQLIMENAVPGVYRVQVAGSAIATTSPQSFVLASSTALGAQILPCVDVYEPNETIETAFGRLGSGTSIFGKNCQASDVDFYRFVVERSGPVSASVTASDTPLRVTLFANGVTVQTLDVPAGATRTIETSAGSGTDLPIAPINYAVRIEPTAAPGGLASYTLTVNFRYVAARARSIRR